MQSASGVSFKSQFLYLLVYITRYIDLLYDPGSLYNIIFKIVFLASQTYIIYLMLNDYKPTHDPNLDTFKVEYLLGFSAVMGILFPYFYTPTEVLRDFSTHIRRRWRCLDIMVLLNLARICSNFTSAFHATTNWRGRDNYHALSFCFGSLPGVVYP